MGQDHPQHGEGLGADEGHFPSATRVHAEPGAAHTRGAHDQHKAHHGGAHQEDAHQEDAHSHEHHHHHHGFGHSHGHGAARGPLTIALVLTASFMLVEAVAGLLTGSLALLADAGHMLSDAGALGIALIANRLASRPPDERQTMGYQRAEVLGAGINAGVLVVLALWIAAEAIGRLGTQPEIMARPMIVVATLGLVVNLGIFFLLSRQGHDLNTRAAMLHVLGDALGSVGALVAAGLILWKGYTWADATASLVIAVILLLGSTRVLREVASVLMHAAPKGLDVPSLQADLLGVQGVAQIHELNAWTLRPGEDVVSVHVVLEPQARSDEVGAKVRGMLSERLGNARVTVQTEPNDAACC